jgi:putative transposase
MTKSTVVPFGRPSEFSPDPLTEVIQAGARELPRNAVQVEVAAFMAEHAQLLDDAGRQRLVRHGFLPERKVMTGIGTVPVQVPRLRDRGVNEDGGKIRFRSSLVPPYLRKAKSIEELLPWLYFEGHFDRGLQRSAGCPFGARCRGSVGLDDHAAEGDLVERV